MKTSWLRWIDRYQISDTAVLGAVALGLGLATGIGIWAFKELIHLSHLFFTDVLGGYIETYEIWTLALLPVLGGLIVGLIQHYFIGVERHHGVAGIIESVALSGGRLRYWRIPAKTIASAISIGSGGSVGPEDPSVQIGSNLGSMFGSLLRMSEERVRTLVAAGAAAGIASAFNAPIAGVFFAVEIILGEIGTSALGVVVLSSVISSVFTQAVSGVQPAFNVPPYSFNSIWQLPLYFVLGAVAGPLSALYVRFTEYLRQKQSNNANSHTSESGFAPVGHLQLMEKILKPIKEADIQGGERACNRTQHKIQWQLPYGIK